MNIRKRYIVPRTALPADSYTFRVELPAVGALTALEVIVEAQNGSSGCVDTTMNDALTMVQLIADGSRPIVNLTGRMLDKLTAYYNYGVYKSLWNQTPNATQTYFYLIPFGRYYGDMFYWLRLQDYSSLYLDLIFAFTISATGFVTGNKFITVIGHFLEPTPTVRLGVLKHCIFTTFTTEASGERMIKLPQGNLIPWIYIYTRHATVPCRSIFTWLKLDVNDGALILTEGRWDELVQDNFVRDGIQAQMKILAFRADNTTIETTLDAIDDVKLTLQHTYTAGANVPVYAIRSISGSTITFSGVLVSGTSTYAAAALDTTPRSLRLEVWQKGVGSWLKLQPGLSYEQEDFIDTTKYANVRLLLTQGTAGASVSIIPVEVLV